MNECRKSIPILELLQESPISKMEKFQRDGFYNSIFLYHGLALIWGYNFWLDIIKSLFLSKNPARNWNGWQNPLTLSKFFHILIKKGIKVAVVSTNCIQTRFLKNASLCTPISDRDMCAVVQSDSGFKLLSFF